MDLELNLFFKMPDQVAYEKWQWQSHMQRRIIDSNGHLFCVIFLHFLYDCQLQRYSTPIGPLIMSMKVWLAVGDFCPDRHHQIWPRFFRIFEQASINLPNLSGPQDWPVEKAEKSLKISTNCLFI